MLYGETHISRKTELVGSFFMYKVKVKYRDKLTVFNTSNVNEFKSSLKRGSIVSVTKKKESKYTLKDLLKREWDTFFTRFG